MRRHVIALVSGIVLLLASVVFMSCVPKNSTSTTPTDGIAYKSDVAAVNARVDTQSQRIDSVAGKSGLSQSDVQALINSALADYAKKSDVTSAVQALKNDQTWITGTTHITPAGTTAGDYGQLVDTNGDLELWLEKVSGTADADILTTSAGPGSTNKAVFYLAVLNKDSSSRHNFKATFTFSPQENVTLIGGDVSSDADNGWILTTNAATRAAGSSDDLTFKSNERSVAKSDVEEYRVYLYIGQTTSGMIDWDINYDVMDMGD